jgi:hypothetical protein
LRGGRSSRNAKRIANSGRGLRTPWNHPSRTRLRCAHPRSASPQRGGYSLPGPT